MREHGAERPSFAPIVAAGPHGAAACLPARVPVGRGELVVIDWGAEVDGYCSDCTRTIAAGPPGDEAREIYELVLAAAARRRGCGPGRCRGREVDTVARAVIEAAGHGGALRHGLGHGVGIEIHEAPRLSQRSDDVLHRGNVVTVEPGVYLPAAWALRIEDLVVVGEQGCEIPDLAR